MQATIDPDYVGAMTEQAAQEVLTELYLIREPGETALEALLWAVDQTLVRIDEADTVLTGRDAVLRVVAAVLRRERQS